MPRVLRIGFSMITKSAMRTIPVGVTHLEHRAVINVRESNVTKKAETSRCTIIRSIRSLDNIPSLSPQYPTQGASVGGVVFDGSLRTQLSQLRDSLTKG